MYDNENTQFCIGQRDTIFVIARNNSFYVGKDGVTNLITKMMVIKNDVSVDLGLLGKFLKVINIKRLNIFCINNELNDETIHYVHDNNISNLRYGELNLKRFKEFLNSDINF